VKHKLTSLKIIKQGFIIFFLLWIFSSATSDLYSQERSKPTRQSSIEAFSDGKYEVAYTEFTELLKMYPKDPLYKYYSGVSLIKMETDPDKAADLLQEALRSSSVVKSLPSDATFYLGRAQQMSGNFEDAIKSYNLYSSQAGKRAARERNVPELIQQSRENRGMITKTTASLHEVKEKEEPAVPEKVQVETAVAKPVETESTVKVNLPADYSKLLNEALNLQFRADSLNALAGKQREELGKLPVNEQAGGKLRISETEKLAVLYQKRADEKYAEANALMNPVADRNDLVSEKAEPEIMKDTVIQPEPKIIQNDLPVQPLDSPIVTIVQHEVIPEESPVFRKEIETYEFFEIHSQPVTDREIKIEIDPEIPAGLIYRIQIAVFRNPVALTFFKGISPIYGFKLPSGVTGYYAGMFRRSADARKALTEVRALGFKDAFIVAQVEGKSVSAERAAVLEKEWGKKPFVSIGDIRMETPVDTVPPSLVFRVEVTRSPKPLKDDAVEDIRKMSGNRGFDIETIEDGTIVYLIGKFITFASAADYADLLVRNGYRDARVVAWLGKKEIPVETARKLFETP
jgi:tetratricopeptide (TPR) repeat protein